MRLEAFADADLWILAGAGAAGAALCLRRAFRTALRRLPWLLLAFATAAGVTARWCWWLHPRAGDSAISTPGAVLHLAAFVAAAAALLLVRAPMPGRPAARRTLLDAFTVVVALVLVTSNAVLGNGPWLPGAASTLATSDIGADVVLAALAVVVLSCARNPGGLALRALLPLCAGVLAFAAGDVGVVGAALAGHTGTVIAADLMSAGGFLLVAAATIAGDESDGLAVMPRRERIAVCAAVIPVVLAALAIVGYRLTVGRLTTGIAVAIVVLTASLLVRLIVALLDNLVLSRTLETQVAERTLEIVTREQWFRSLVQHSSDVVTVLDVTGTIRYQSPAIERLFGYDPTETTGTPLISLVPPEDAAWVAVAIAQASATPGSSYVLEFPMLHTDGTRRDTETVITSLLDDDDVQGLVLNTRDVTERKQLEQRLTHQAYYDALTGLGNRALFQHELAGVLAKPATGEDTVAVLFCDLDGFKAVNDSQGHEVGDALLRVVADRLRRCVRPGDVVARFGGDEFAVLIRDERALDAAREVADRMAASLQSPIVLDSRELRVGVSIGIAGHAADAGSVDILLRNADLAMYRAKADRRVSVVVFEREMHDALLARLAVEDDLRTALGCGQLVLHYQPTVDLVTGAMVGVEALMRWYRPGEGIVKPEAFIEIAEDNGFIEVMGQWALFEACRQAAEWQQYAGPAVAFSVGVNISARQVTPALVDVVAAAVAESGIPPSALLLEMTETVLLDRTEEAIDVLRAVKRLGVRIAIDDFGTGFSSLSYLSRFPVDVLKIDKNFIDAVDRPGERAELTKTIVALGTSLRLATVAEGIERQPQAAALRELGCRFGQGYLFSRPLPASGVTELLQLGGQTRRSTAVTRPSTVASSPGIGA